MTALRDSLARHIDENHPMEDSTVETHADRPFSFCEYDRVALWEIDTKIMEHHSRLRRCLQHITSLEGDIRKARESFLTFQSQQQTSTSALGCDVEQLFQAIHALRHMVELQFDLLRHLQESFRLHADMMVWSLTIAGIRMYNREPVPPPQFPSLAIRMRHFRPDRRPGPYSP